MTLGCAGVHAEEPPGTPAPEWVGVSSISWTWSLAEEATGYNVYSASEPATLIATLAAPPYLAAGLAGNSECGILVSALDPEEGESGPSAAVSTWTLAALPGGPVILHSGTTEQLLAWEPGGNSPGTSYLLRYSTAADFSGNVTTLTVVHSTYAVVTALIPDTAYYYDVAAVGHYGAATGFTGSPASSYTLTAVPGAPVVYGVYVTSQSLAWPGNGNPPGTGYLVEYSTSPGFETEVTTGVVLTSTFGVFSGLLANTSYFYDVAAIGHDGLRTVFTDLAAGRCTLAAAPGPPAITGRSSATQAVEWAENGNPPGTTYLLRYSTSANFTARVTTVTALTSPSAAVSGLTPDTSYYYSAAARNKAGVLTAYSGAAAGYTAAALPGGPLVITVSSRSQSISWASGGNPSWTTYQLRYSTSADFAADITSAAVAATTFTAVIGLQPNTSYYYDVAAIGRDSARTDFSGSPAVGCTLAAVPGAPVITGHSTITQTVAWAAGSGSPPDAAYLVRYSVSASFPPAVTTTSVAASTFTTAAGLVPNTPYYYSVAALNRSGLPSAYTGSVSGYTAAVPPGRTFIIAASSSSQTLSWNSGGNALPGTTYRLRYSTSADFAVSAATDAVVSSTFTKVNGLAPNTSYYYDVAVLAGDGAAGSFTGLPSSGYTLAAKPGAPAVTGRSSSTLSFAWGSGGNPAAGTTYRIRYSTSGVFDAAIATQAVLASTFTTVAGLAAGLYYYFDVAAYNAAGLLTAYTGTPAGGYTISPEPGAPVPAVLGTSSMSWTWAAARGATSYKVYAASEPASLIGYAGSPAFIRLRLSTNTLNGILVSAVNPSGEGAKSAPGSAHTLAAKPLSLSTGPEGAAIDGLTVQWSAGSNPPGTQYRVDWWKAAGATSTLTTELTGAYIPGLAAGTTYFIRLRAVNGDGQFTAPASLQAATLAAAPQELYGTVLGTGSVRWNWSAVPTATGYNVYPSSDPAAPVALTSATSVLRTGLAPNTSDSVRVAVRNTGGVGPQSADAAEVWTLANPPSGLAAAGVYISSVALSWNLNGNPLGTKAEVEGSADRTSFAAAQAGAFTGYTYTGLAACTSFYFRVRNFNEAGAATAYSSTLTVFMNGEVPLPPGALSAAPLGGYRIRLSWEPSPSPGVASYLLYYDAGSGAVDYSVPLAELGPSETGYTTGVLASSSSYKFGLRAVRCGTRENNVTVTAAAASTAGLTGVSAAIRAPQAGRKVYGDRVTLLAEPVRGGGEIGSLLFQYRAAGSSDWLDVAAAGPAHPNPDENAPYLVHWDVTTLAPSAYELRAVAVDRLGRADPAPPQISISAGPADPDISEYSQAGDSVKKEQRVYSAVSNTVETGDAGTAQVARLVIPAGALAASTAAVSVTNNPALAPPPPDDTLPCGMAVEVKLSDGQTQLCACLHAAVTLSYQDEDGDGLVDGTGIRASSLRLYSAETPAGPWKRVAASTVNTASRTVTGLTPHFSYFALFVPLAADLSAVEVSPVPFMPGDGDPDNGVEYSASDPDSGIVFDKLPASVSIKIYDLSGQLVAGFGSAGGAGRLRWDARNGAGEKVASGGYFAVITSPGHRDVVKKLLVIR